ncbi:MAG: hypothetical protein HY981_01695 [Candidatus Magasanikbacteria bacterium]|nr:hypothetical protein [Candidatus Magasanikbacteria bacterium]
MPNPEFAREHGQEDLALRITTKLNELIAHNPSVPLGTIAELLGAQDFFTMVDAGGHGRTPVYHLDVREFVADLKNKKELQDLTLPAEFTMGAGVIVPPDTGEIISGNGGGLETKQIFPRTRYLIEVLTDLKLPYEIHDGINTPDMMRTLSYKAFVLPTINKLVLVCNEEGNATFIVHKLEIDEHGQSDWKKYASMTKGQLRELGLQQVSVVIYNQTSSEWKTEIKDRINNGEVEEKISKDKKEPTELAPEGWETITGLSSKVNRNKIVVKTTVAPYRDDNPGWFKEYKHRTRGVTREFFHPTLVKIVEDIFKERKKAPEGWEITETLTDILQRSDKLIKTIAEKYRAAHPEWFKMYDDKIGRSNAHFHPDLIAEIKREMSTRKKAPEGWKTIGELIKKLKRSKKSIKTIAEKYRAAHPEWFKMYDDKIGRSAEHLHPDLVKEIIEILDKKH